MYNLIARGIEQEYLPACRELGVANVVYNPLAGGLLTGKHIDERPVEGSRFDTNQQYFDRYWFGENFNAIKTLKELACGANRSLISLALNWLLHHSETEGVILGASSLEQLQANLSAAQEGAMSEDVVIACDQVWARLRGASPIYNR